MEKQDTTELFYCHYDSDVVINSEEQRYFFNMRKKVDVKQNLVHVDSIHCC